jgi:hypothetical protein
MFDFRSPSGENGYSGYAELAVYGEPSDMMPADAIAMTAENQATSLPTWTVETDSLIKGWQPGSVGAGSFAGGFNGDQVTRGLPALTDGSFGSGTVDFATCGGGPGAGTSLTYISTNGWDLSSIVVYSGWGNFDRDGQFYNVSYSTLSAPTTFIPLANVHYNPASQASPSANRLTIARFDGSLLASQVAAVKFDFTRQNGSLDYGYSGYAEIVLQGSNLAQATAPVIHQFTVSGSNLILTGTGGTPGRSYTWLTSANVMAPVAAWTAITNGVYDANGGCSNAVPITASEEARFFRIRTPQAE